METRCVVLTIVLICLLLLIKLCARDSCDRTKTDEEIMIRSYLPHCCVGPIVKGFGRGSKDLGCPTGKSSASIPTRQFYLDSEMYWVSANFALEVVQKLPPAMETGVYIGWAKVDNGDVHKAVLSIGWNPFYANKEKSVVCLSSQHSILFRFARNRFRAFSIFIV